LQRSRFGCFICAVNMPLLSTFKRSGRIKNYILNLSAFLNHKPSCKFVLPDPLSLLIFAPNNPYNDIHG
jgi:hypothetical protein